MAADNSPDSSKKGDAAQSTSESGSGRGRPREKLERHRLRLEDEADRAVDQFDERIVELLSWVLDTETRARIYVYLRQHPWGTSDEIADGTGLYPSTVREALAELHGENILERRKRKNSGAGNNPYEYTAMPPSELVTTLAEQVQDELNTVFNLDCYLGKRDPNTATEPVTITVEEADGE